MLSITGATNFQTPCLKNEKSKAFGTKLSQLAMHQKLIKLNCHQNFAVGATYRDGSSGGGGAFLAGFVLGADFGTLAYAFAPQHKSSFSLLSSSSLTRRRGQVLIPKAGPPNTTTLILAFVFPLSLFAGTVFASIRIADKLDEQFLEDLAVNRAIMEENEEDEEERVEDGDGITYREEEVAAAAATADVPRVRNRPRKEA